jgi:hypothetical protein
VLLAGSAVLSQDQPVFSTFLAGYWFWLTSMLLLTGSGLWAWWNRSKKAAKEPERRYQHASDVKHQVQSIKVAPPAPSDRRKAPQGSGSREFAIQIVVGPADCLILSGSLAFVTALGVGLWLCPKWNEDVSQLTTTNLVGMSIANIVYGLLTATAGRLMRRLSARLFTLMCLVVGGLFIPAVGALNIALELKSIPQWPVLIPMWLGCSDSYLGNPCTVPA